MSLTSKRQLPNLNNEKIRQVNAALINAENDIRNAQQNFKSFKQTRFLVDTLRNNDRLSTVQKNTDHANGHSTFTNDQGKIRYDLTKTITKAQLDTNDKILPSKPDSLIEKVVQARFDRRLLDIERELKRNREGQHQHKSIVYNNNDDKTSSYEYQSGESPMKKILLTQQNSTSLRECAKSIRENVMQFKDELMRHEIKRERSTQKEEEILSLLNRQRKTEGNHVHLENEYLIQQQSKLSKSTTLNEMLYFKNELAKNERQREQLSDQVESLMKTCDQKEKIISKTLVELKEVTENCDTFERQNFKLQQDLTLALERLEEMTDQAERFAQESLNSQKQLADSEQKREEFQIQAQETIKQWKARTQKLDKDIERYKLDSTHMSEKNEQLIKEIDSYKLQNLTLKEQIMKIETDLNDSNINYNRLEEQFKRNDTDFQAICLSQKGEIATLKKSVNELSSQISIQRQRLIQIDKDKHELQQLLQEEMHQRNNSESKLKQYEQDIEKINLSRSQLQQQIHELDKERKDLLLKLKEIQFEKESLLKEKTRLLAIENEYHEIKVQLSDERTRIMTLQRYEIEHKKEIERLQDKSAKYEDESIQGQHTIETLSRDIHDKSRSVTELESKINKLTVELTNQRNENLKKDNHYQNSLQSVYNEIVYCTKCLSHDSTQPFIIEHAIIPRDNIDIWLSKLKAHLAWFKQELEIHREQENKLRQDLNTTLHDCESDRTYFASELAKREAIINKITNNHQDFQQHIFDTTNEYTQFGIQLDYNKHRLLTEDQRGHIDDRYRQFQIMIDSVKQELQTAKVQLSA